MVRIGVLSDLHCELEPAGSRWINAFESELLDGRIDAALQWFAEDRVELILVLGDLVQFPNVDDLEHVLARLAAADVAPLATVNGNHDLRLDGRFAECVDAHGVRLLHEEPLMVEGVAVTGVAVDRGPVRPQYVGRLGGADPAADLVLVASHFPLLSEASRVAATGLPYAGDLVNRAELEGALRSDPRPKILLSGHIHARCSAHDRSLLQFTVGALIEPPFDGTIVEIDASDISARRTARRLGEIAEIDPVLCPDDERWRWAGDRWDPTGEGLGSR